MYINTHQQHVFGWKSKDKNSLSLKQDYGNVFKVKQNVKYQSKDKIQTWNMHEANCFVSSRFTLFSFSFINEKLVARMAEYQNGL